MRTKALLALVGLVLGLMLMVGCSSNTNTHTIRGVVNNAATGQPVTGAVVTLFRDGTQVGLPVITGADGIFVFPNVKQGGGYTITVHSSVGDALIPRFENNDHLLPFVITVGPTGATVSGIVTNGTTGLPQQGATVTLLQNGTPVTGITPATTDANGMFILNGVPVGNNYTLQVSGTGFTTVISAPFDVTSTAPVTVPVTIAGATLSGTVTNASTGLPEQGATVTLLQNGTPVPGVAPVTTNANGQYTFNNVSFGNNTGTNLAVQVSGTGFTTVTSPAFNITSTTPTPVNISVGSGIGSTVAGNIQTTDTTATFTAVLAQNGNTLQTVTAVRDNTGVPQFSFPNVQSGNGYTITVGNNSNADAGILAAYGPFTVPAGASAPISVFFRTAAEVATDGVPAPIPPSNGLATLAAYVSGGSTIAVNNGAPSAVGNPSFLTNVATGSSQITITPVGGNAVTFTYVVPANTVVEFRLAPTP